MCGSTVEMGMELMGCCAGDSDWIGSVTLVWLVLFADLAVLRSAALAFVRCARFGTIPTLHK